MTKVATKIRKVNILAISPSTGEWYVKDVQDYHNIPLDILFPNEDVTLIEWVSDEKDIRPSNDPKGGKCISQEIMVDGKTYRGDLNWGSNVKECYTFGTSSDFGRCLYKNVEDGVRFSRWMMAQGWYGISDVRPLKIKTIPAGQTFNNLPIDDGFGYISKELAEDIYNGRDPIKLQKAKGSYTFWQRITLNNKLKRELKPYVQEKINYIEKDMPDMYYDHLASFDTKKELVDLDSNMIHHPFVANMLGRSLREYFVRAATSVYAGQQIRVAVPTQVADAVLPPGKNVLTRYPVDSNGSIQAFPENTTPEYIAEYERISNMEVIQYSLSSKKVFAKGCLGIEDDLDGYDLVLCEEDVKMGKLDKITKALLSFTAYYSAGSAFGINVQTMKDVMGYDADGDMGEIINCNELPELWNAVKSMKNGTTPKLIKTKRSLEKADLRGEMIVKSMSNLVGMSSNVSTKTLATLERELLAHSLGYEDEQTMDKRLNYFIKCGTDGFKTDVDLIDIEKKVKQFDSALENISKFWAPWIKWNRDPETFKHDIPLIVHEILNDDIDGGYKYVTPGGTVDLDKDQLKIIVHPRMNGTIAWIARQMLPVIGTRIGEPIKVRPLSYYLTWAPIAPSKLISKAKSLNNWFGRQSKTVNWKDGEEIRSFRASFMKHVNAWIGKNDPQDYVHALWRVAHATRSKTAGGGSVFFAFPDECKEIISNKPGRNSNMVVITGIHYQVPGFTNYTGEIEIMDIEDKKSGKLYIRKAVCAKIDGQLEPRDTRYPRNMIALISSTSDQIKSGIYNVIITQKSEKSWTMIV